MYTALLTESKDFESYIALRVQHLLWAIGSVRTFIINLPLYIKQQCNFTLTFIMLLMLLPNHHLV